MLLMRSNWSHIRKNARKPPLKRVIYEGSKTWPLTSSLNLAIWIQGMKHSLGSQKTRLQGFTPPPGGGCMRKK